MKSNLCSTYFKMISRHTSRSTLECHLICIELSFLAESWRHVLGLNLLLGHVALVLAEKMLVLNLHNDHMGVQSHFLVPSPHRLVYTLSPQAEITWLDFTKDFGPMSNCDCGGGAMWPPWPLKSGLVRWRPIVGEYLS